MSRAPAARPSSTPDALGAPGQPVRGLSRAPDPATGRSTVLGAMVDEDGFPWPSAARMIFPTASSREARGELRPFSESGRVLYE
jgi:hypothetical protein